MRRILSIIGIVSILTCISMNPAIGGDAKTSKPSPKIEKEAWQKVKLVNTFEAAVDFVKKHPGSVYVKEARSTYGRKGTKHYKPKSMTFSLFRENSGDGPYGIVEVGGRPSQQRSEKKDIPIEEGIYMLQTADDLDVWYEIVASDRVEKGIQIVTENLRVYLIYGLSFNFTGRIKPL